jgi:hypothetical protein
MLAPVTHILSLVNVRRPRLLASNGRVMVRVNQKVCATDIVAESQAESKHILIDVYQALSLRGNKKSEQWISRKVGDRIQKDDILAEAGGMFKRVLRSPADCQIISAGGGQIMLEMAGDTLTLQAGISGWVSDIIPDRGAIIEGNGVLVQGVWGNDKINMGLLLVSISNPDDELTSNRLDSSMQGTVLVFGHCSSPAVLKDAADLNIRGLILGSMASDLVSLVKKINFPVILTDGFGHLPINQMAYKILVSNDKRDVALNAASWDHFTGERPEIFIQLPTIGVSTPELDEFSPGQIVRIQGASLSGRIGEIAAVHTEPVVISNGLRAPAAEIYLGGQKILVPLVNL